ncbi:MAG TPA: alpha/beta hydrolase [Roseiarcus sp.]
MRLVSIPSNPVPEGAVTGAVKTSDGVLLRYARWDCGPRCKGTVCVLQGRAEYVEKYFEIVRELRSRGFAVVIFDWRGQGASGRALADPRKGYVQSFRQYDTDLDTVMSEVAAPNHPPPLIGLAHSMGGAVLLRSAANGRRYFDRIVLTAPMIGLPSVGSSGLARAAFRAMRACGFGAAYVPGGSRTLTDLKPFGGNWRTSDPERYARNAAIIATEPALALGSPTIAWTDAALAAMEEFAGAGYPRRIRERMLVVTAGRDQIVSTAASGRFVNRSSAASHLIIAGAKHEVLMEQNQYREQFWSAFDSFAG